jgi:hypothetical protein
VSSMLGECVTQVGVSLMSGGCVTHVRGGACVA